MHNFDRTHQNFLDLTRVVRYEPPITRRLRKSEGLERASSRSWYALATIPMSSCKLRPLLFHTLVDAVEKTVRTVWQKPAIHHRRTAIHSNHAIGPTPGSSSVVSSPSGTHFGFAIEKKGKRVCRSTKQIRDSRSRGALFPASVSQLSSSWLLWHCRGAAWREPGRITE
jgi:hypothetical protein